MTKTCLITGVGPGTGSALVRRFVEGGYNVAMLARSEDRLASLKDEISAAHAYTCDVSVPEALDATYAAVKSDLGAPSIIVHNAVGAEQGTYMNIDPDGMRKAFEINTMALLQLARLATDDMIAGGPWY